MFTGNKDTDLMIMMELPDKDLFNFCKTNKYINYLCDNEHFWRNRYYRKYGTPKYNKPDHLTWKRFYNIFYGETSENGIKITVEIDRNNPIVTEMISSVKNDYYDRLTRYNDYGLKDDDELVDVIGKNIVENFVDENAYDIYDISENIYYRLFQTNNFTYSALTKNINPTFTKWNRNLMNYLIQNSLYMDLSFNGKVKPLISKDQVKNFPNYLFIDTLGVAGTVDDIRNYFIDLMIPRNNIDPHINNAINREKMLIDYLNS